MNYMLVLQINLDHVTHYQTTNFRLFQTASGMKRRVKGGYLDFSHLTKLKNIYFTEIYMKKQYKSSIIKNHKITKENKFLMVFP